MVLSSFRQFDLDSRDRLYFDQFEFSIRFKLAHSGRMRSLDSIAIANSCAHARNLNQTMRGLPTVSEQQEHCLHSLATQLLTLAHPYKRIVYSDWQYVYTNHVEVFDSIETCRSFLSYISYHQAVINQPRDTVVLKHSKYQYRSYFREAWYSNDQIQTLQQFLLSRPEQFRMTDHWRNRWQRRHIYITRSNFVDHHHAQDALLLQMAVPGCVRKTVPILRSP